MTAHPTPGPGGVSRRAVVRTAAWAVPTVSLVAAAPAYAASPPLPTFQYAAGGPVSWFTWTTMGTPVFVFTTFDALLQQTQTGVLTLPTAPTRPVSVQVRVSTTGPSPAGITPRFILGGAVSLDSGPVTPNEVVEAPGVATWTGVLPPGALAGGPNPLDVLVMLGDNDLQWPPTQVDLTFASEEFGTFGPLVHVAPAVFPPFGSQPLARGSAGGPPADLLGTAG